MTLQELFKQWHVDLEEDQVSVVLTRLSEAPALHVEQRVRELVVDDDGVPRQAVSLPGVGV